MSFPATPSVRLETNSNYSQVFSSDGWSGYSIGVLGSSIGELYSGPEDTVLAWRSQLKPKQLLFAFNAMVQESLAGFGWSPSNGREATLVFEVDQDSDIHRKWAIRDPYWQDDTDLNSINALAFATLDFDMSQEDEESKFCASIEELSSIEAIAVWDFVAFAGNSSRIGFTAEKTDIASACEATISLPHEMWVPRVVTWVLSNHYDVAVQHQLPKEVVGHSLCDRIAEAAGVKGSASSSSVYSLR